MKLHLRKTSCEIMIFSPLGLFLEKPNGYKNLIEAYAPSAIT